MSRAVLEVTCSGTKVRDSLSSVLAPDNEGGPKGLRISVGEKGKTLTVSIEADSPSTAISTSLAFLRDVSLFQEVWLLSQRAQG